MQTDTAAKQNAIDCAPLEVKYFACGTQTIRGLGATRDINNGEVLLQVPYSSFLNADNILKVFFPQLNDMILQLEKFLDQNNIKNPVVANDPLSSTALHSCEFVITTFLLLAKFGNVPNKLAEYIEALPGLFDVSTPEMLFLFEYGDCPTAYIDSCSEVISYRQTNRQYTSREMTVLLGSSERFEKLQRRMSKQFFKYCEVKNTYFCPFDDTFEIRQLGAQCVSFPRWLWARHMINSRSFMYRRPSWCDYPCRFEMGFDAESLSSSSESNEGEAPSSLHKQLLEKISAVNEDESHRASKIACGEGDTDSASDVSSDDDEDDQYTLIPFADLFNHCPINGTGDFTFDKKTCMLTIRADKPYFRGDEVTLKYNNMDHWRFAKYYGFVPNVRPGSGESGHTCKYHGSTDAFPICVPLPPVISTGAPNSTVLEVTKTQLFEGKSLRRHCYVTSRGPNQQLLSVSRLRFLTEPDFPKYWQAYEPEPLSIRNEWQVFRFLKDELGMRKLELERNHKRWSQTPDGNAHAPSFPTQGLSCRGLTAIAVRERDLRVLELAYERCKSKFEDLCGLVYYGTATQDSLRTNIIHAQFRKLKEMGHLPKTLAEQRDCCLGLLPPMAPSSIAEHSFLGVNVDRFSVRDYVATLQERLESARRREHLKQ